ncbi:RNA-directed DNA polymerase, eukaryota, reverse transcriptase zinc-binding domain protein, partial [Tanacetum coccineum]
MIHYFKEKWEDDRQKEKSSSEENLEDVMENADQTDFNWLADEVRGGKIIYWREWFVERKILWRDLKAVKTIINDHPWMLAGDFNVTLKVEEHSGGSNMTSDMQEFKDCSFLRTVDNVNPIFDAESMFNNKLEENKAIEMISEVTDLEIKNAVFDIGDAKAPGPDGSTSAFFKNSWKIVGKDVCSVVRDFLNNGKLLGEVNATLISLVPKVTQPAKISEFRPIACCNVLYKYSLLSQELLKGYNFKNGPKRCALKVDIAKAYDTVNWGFLENILNQFGFHEKMEGLWVKWVNRVKLKGKSFWEVSAEYNDSGTWKALLDMRDKVRPYNVNDLGDGSKTSMWHDNWNVVGPLSKVINSRCLYDARLSNACTVKDMIKDNGWIWPSEWQNQFPILNQVAVPFLHNGRSDMVKWKSKSGKRMVFSVNEAWKDLKDELLCVNWWKCVWFPQCNPSYDSHNHIFFKCEFSAPIWDATKRKMNAANATNEWDQIVQAM